MHDAGSFHRDECSLSRARQRRRHHRRRRALPARSLETASSLSLPVAAFDARRSRRRPAHRDPIAGMKPGTACSPPASPQRFSSLDGPEEFVDPSVDGKAGFVTAGVEFCGRARAEAADITGGWRRRGREGPAKRRARGGGAGAMCDGGAGKAGAVPGPDGGRTARASRAAGHDPAESDTAIGQPVTQSLVRRCNSFNSKYQ